MVNDPGSEGARSWPMHNSWLSCTRCRDSGVRSRLIGAIENPLPVPEVMMRETDWLPVVLEPCVVG